MQTQLDLIRKHTDHGGQPLGDLLWWELSNAFVTRTELSKLWVQGALPIELLPEEPTPEKAFRTAVREVQVGQSDKLLRLAKDDEQEVVFGVVTEQRDGTGGLTYQQEARLALNRKTGIVAADVHGHNLVRRVFDRFEELKLIHTADDIRRTIVRTLGSFAAVTLRQTGGVYWVPAPYAEALRRLQAIVAKLGESMMHLVPITKSEEGQASLAQAAQASIEQELTALQTEVQEFLAIPPERVSTLVRRLTTYEDLRRRASLYQTVLSAQVGGLAEALAQMERQVHGLLADKRAKAA